MKFGTSLSFEKQLGYKEALKHAAKAGFKYVDFNLAGLYDCDVKDEEKVFKELLKITEGEGLKVGQAHAPSQNGMYNPPETFLCEEWLDRQRAAIRQAAILKSPYVVEHLFVPNFVGYEFVRYDYDKLKEENFERNVEFCLKLKDYLKEYNVKMALENIITFDLPSRMHVPATCSSSAECNRYIDALGEENFCICLDAGHLNLVAGETHTDFISRLGKRIEVLHLHDNFGILNDWFGELDRHLPPFVGCLEWDKLRKALKSIGFDGVYSFEGGAFGPVELIDEHYNYVYKAFNLIFNKDN